MPHHESVLQAIAGETTSLQQVWIWILAPLVGAALAALVYKALTCKKRKIIVKTQ